MNDVVVKINDLVKVYRLYQNNGHRVRAMLGLFRHKPGSFSEHKALFEINLEIKKGEKVAIIGRNGAGKSTLLKLITGVIEPTSGNVVVVGDTQALLQIGTGFHPDFTGRENVFAYLAQIGLVGTRAAKHVEEIISFAEIEEYIDQPVKTYSTGMAMRLMFAASTVITPDILVIDEVLGVGDAYFAKKSYDRIKELSSERGTTVILVSHDIYSAADLCERMIWLDQGQILLDGETNSVISRYEASIRDQTELRLRNKRLKSLEENLKNSEAQNEDKPAILFGQIRCVGNTPIDVDLPIETISFFNGVEEIFTIQVAEEQKGQCTLLTESKEGNWGPVEMIDGRNYRKFSRSGSVFHRAGFFVRSEAVLKAINDGTLTLKISFLDAAKEPCLVEVIDAENTIRLKGHLENIGSDNWLEKVITLFPTTELEASVSGKNRYGTQDFAITNVTFFNADKNEAHVFEVGSKMHIKLDYKIGKQGFKQRPVIHVSFLRDGITRSHRFTMETAEFDQATRSFGELEIIADPLVLAPGEYLINVVVMSEGGYEKDAAKVFFTANDKLLDHHSRSYQIEVVKTGNVLVDDTVFLHAATWVKDGEKVYSGIYSLDDGTKISTQR